MLAKFLQFLVREAGRSAVRARRSTPLVFWQHFAPPGIQLLQPVFDATQWFVITSRVKEHECQIRIVKKKRMDEPIIILPCKIPQDGLTLLPSRRCLLSWSNTQNCWPCVEECSLNAPCQPPTKSRLANAGVAHQHDLRAGAGDFATLGLPRSMPTSNSQTWITRFLPDFS